MPSKPPEGYLFDMLEAARKIGRFLEGYDLEQSGRRKKPSAPSSASSSCWAKRVDPAFRAEFPEINFRLASLMRNVVIHHYDRVDLDRLWEAAKGDVPGVIRALEPFLAQRRGSSEGGS